MEKTKLRVELRNDKGKEANKKFRREGIVPAVLYSPHNKSNLLEVTLKEKLAVEVRVELIGEPIGVKEGGILELELREVEIECLPSQIPESLKADISHLKINDHLTAGELALPEGVELLTESDRIIASVHPPTKMEEVV